MDPDTAAEQRANAVARLRRAASLPRMKDGRRPPVPMHGEAGGVSEGERGQVEGKGDDQTTSTTPEAETEPENATDPPRSSPNTTPVVATSAMAIETPTNDVDTKQQDVEELEGEVEAEVEAEAEGEVEAETGAEAETENERSPTPASGAESSTTKEKGKRRSRSRSRSRGSRDLRAKIRAANEAAAAAAQATLSGDAVDDESPPAALNTAQHYFMQLAAAHGQSPAALLSPLSPFGYGTPPGASTAMGGPMSPAGIPTLQALQTRHLQGGLFRSNSAAARLMAMHKLTGEPLDISNTGINGNGTPRAASPLGASQIVGGGRLGLSGLTRNNTVAGGERIAARQQLLRRLNERIQEKERSDVETTSGAEETGPAPSAVTKGRRRRSRRKSQSHVVDDRDLAASTTPSATPAPADNLYVPYPPPQSIPGPSGVGMDVQRPFSPFAPLAALNAPLPPSRAPSVPLEKQHQQMQLMQQFHEYQSQQAMHQHMQHFEALRRTPDPHLRILRQHTPSPMPAAPQTVPNQRPTPEMQFRRTPDPRTPTPTATTPEPSTSHLNANHYLYDSPIVHRGLVIEDEDPDDFPAQPTPPSRGARGPVAGLPTPSNQLSMQHSAASPAMRAPHGSDAPSTLSTDSSDSTGGQNVPVILSEANRNPFRSEMFPKSPFGTPIKERTLPQQDEERVLYRNAPGSARAERSRFPRGVSEVSNTTVGERASWVAEPLPAIPHHALEMRDSEISWDAQPVPEYHSQRNFSDRDRAPIVSWVTEPGGLRVFDEDDGEEDEEDEDSKEIPVEDTAPQSSSPARSYHSPSRDSGTSQEIIVEQDASETTPSFTSKGSHQSTTSTATMATNARESAISDFSAQRDSSLNLIGRTVSQVSQTESFQEVWSDVQHGDIPPAAGLSTKRSADSSSASTWSKVRTFMRSGSSLGRRSRTNSIAREKKEATATESSRESGASLSQISTKRESRGDTTPAPTSATGSTILTWQQSQAPLSSPSPSASNAMLPLQAPPPPRSGVSPIPPASESDAQRYNDPKLFPFPGMVSLRRGMSASTSSPEIATQSSTSGRPMTPSLSSSVSGQQDTIGGRDRNLSHQASDSRLLQKFQATAGIISGAPSSASQVDYINVIQHPQNVSPPSGLPQTREGVKKWLSVRRLFPSPSQGSNSPSPSHDIKIQAQTQKKPSLSDLLMEKDIEEWEEAVRHVENANVGTNMSNMNTVKARGGLNVSPSTGAPQDIFPVVPIVPKMKEQEISESSPDDVTAAFDYVKAYQPTRLEEGREILDSYDAHESRHLSAPLSSSHDPSSATPDPASSEESPSQSSERSESSMGSLYSPSEIHVDPFAATQARHIHERLEQALLSDEPGVLWNNTLNSPPRKLLLSSPMLQVANHSTVKDRFLFLFNDIVVIAKPMLPERDSLLDPSKLYPPDRKFIIKNVVHLKDVRLNIERDDDPSKLSSALISQRPEFIRNFVQEFAVNPDAAIDKIIDLNSTRGYTTLGRLLVQLPDINRAKLGEYLSRRSSKYVLRAYIDAFGFAGLGIEEALRIFLLSMHIPSSPSNLLESLLDVFAARWFEANDGIVAYSREIVPVLVRAIVRLNEKIHSPLAQDGGPFAYSRTVVNCRDFIDAFRVHDHRGMVSDNVLQGIFNSIKAVKLCQARNPTNGRAPLPVSLKRPIPSHITYRRQSEPVIVRIPQPDDKLEIRLFGQDVTFDPPVLTFVRSSEASFRITGNALGTKTIIMACLGHNAPNYSGLPISTTIHIERAFMRNTFQIAFSSHLGTKRKYMFSVDDPVIKHEWIGSLKRQMEYVNNSQSQLPANINLQVYRAVEALSFKVLQETLLISGTMTPNGANQGTPGHAKTASDASAQVPNSPYGSGTAKEIYKRSQSRSQMYRYGAGKHESDLSNGVDENADGLLEQGSNVRLWTGAELETLCQQNSSIGLVLSFLQVALPYDGGDDTNAAVQFPIRRNVSQSSGYQF